MMKEEFSEGQDLAAGGLGNSTGGAPPESPAGCPRRGGWPEGPRAREWCWEAQWQAFLQSLQARPSLGGKPRGTAESAPWWEESRAFLASFEQVAKACRWPREEWAARLLPALSGEAEQALGSLEASQRGDYGEVKAAILRGEALRMELQRQLFRQFCCQGVEDPRRIHSQLEELCHRWLKPERRSKEQILELVILEQFLASLPPNLQGWIRASGPETCSQAVDLVEDFLRSQREEEEREKGQGSLQEEDLSPMDLEEKNFFDIVQQVQISEDTGGSNTDGPDILVDGMKSVIKMETSEQEELGPKETQNDITSEMSGRNVLGRAKNLERRDESKLQQGHMDPVERDNESPELVEETPASNCQTSLVPQRNEMPLVSRYGRKYRYRSEFLVMYTGENLDECEGENKGNSVVHQSNHTGMKLWDRKERPYECSICGKCFSISGNLTVHQRIHTGKKPYKCSHCGKRFTQKIHLEYHERIHTGEKPYKCSHCEKCFRERGVLKEHERIHTGEKPYKCLHCGKSFRIRGTLRTHQKVHTREKTFQ